MSIKIAICNDELYICSQLEKMIIDILQQMDVKHEIEIFESGEGLCKELERQHFDLIFLDIELPKLTGIDVGRHVRDVLKNELVQIVYISGKEGYAMELFEFRPMNFLVKPLEKEKVTRVLDKYLIITEQGDHMFEYKKRTEYYKIPMSEIIYFESQKRKVKIYTNNGVDEFYDSMENVYAVVKEQDFLFIHKSIIVNYRFIKKITHEEVVMLDDTILPISQSRRTIIRSMYMKIRKRDT